VRRADYPDIRAEQCLDLVYVCDNDWAGKSVLQEFSKQYGGHLVGVMFDQRFPASFDLADPLPKMFFSKKKVYIGPSFDLFKQPASFATEAIERDKGKSFVAIRKTFCEEWLHCIKPEVFVHKDWPARLYSANQFNNLIAPFSQSQETAKLLMKDNAGKGYSLSYDPSREPGPYATEGGSYINTFTPSPIKPGPGSTKPWLDYMEHLIPDEIDRGYVMKWVATLVARPGTRIVYGLLLISETQGVGKSTLGEKILRPLVGELNTSIPSESDIAESSFNSWMAHKRLAVVHEVYSGHSWKVYNKLKSVTTERYVDINRKYMEQYAIENWIHILAMSNSYAAVRMSPDDRRWLIPGVSEKKKSQKYWEEFNNWLSYEGGLQIIRRWADEYGKYIMMGEEAPDTTQKKEVIVESFGPGQHMIYKILNKLKEKLPRCIITDISFAPIVMQDSSHYHEKLNRWPPLQTRKAARMAGWHITPKRFRLPASDMAFLLCTNEEDSLIEKLSDLKDGYVMLGDKTDQENKILSLRTYCKDNNLVEM
jgi:hypothetical protein